MITERIPVVFTPDENFIVQTAVAIMSMLDSKNCETNYYFYIVVSDEIDQAKLKILEKLKNMYDDFQYEIRYIYTEMLDQQKITTRHLSTSAYYRLAIADVLQEEKCMYHDGDILVLDDLTEMYCIDLEHQYVAGIKAIAKMQETEQNYKMISLWGWKDFDQYILSGDLIFNLKKIREDNVVSRFYENVQRGFPSEDQDVINYCCYGNIKFLPLKFCVMNRWFCPNAFSTMPKMVYEQNELQEALKRPVIVHFAGTDTKPWVNLRVVYGKKWWEFSAKILSSEEYKEWYKQAEERTKQRDWDFFLKKLCLDRKIIIFGYSKISKQLYDNLIQNDIAVCGFTDNNSKMWGQEYKGCKVYDIGDILGEIVDYNIIIASQNYRKDIRNQLRDNGVFDDQMVDYYNKSEFYYMSLDAEYYDIELKDVCYRQYGIEMSVPEAKNKISQLNDTEKNELRERYFMKYWLMP